MIGAATDPLSRSIPMPKYSRDGELNISIADLRDAGADGVISPDDAERLIEWLNGKPAENESTVEAANGFNLVTVAYYFGAMLMISACAWFLGDKWESLGSGGILATTLVYFVLAAGLGWWLRQKGYKVGGGLLVTVAVCLTPLIVYCAEDLTGFWPAMAPGAYENYYPEIRGAWILMELVTMAVALAAILRVRFGFLTAPLAFSLWFFSMDIAAWFLGDDMLDWNARAWTAVLVGAIGIVFGFAFDRTLKRPDRSEDFAFWLYLFGLMAFWGGLTSINSDSELGRFVYLLVNVGLVAVSLYLRRTVFLVFGALGIFAYLGHLAYEVFKDSVLFPFALVLLGLGVIVATVLGQKYFRSLSDR
jgi:hypothetical protein